MHDGVGIAVARAKGLAEVDVADLAVGHRIHQAQLIDVDRHAARRLADAQAIEAMEGVGAELDAGADLAQLRAPSRAPARRCPSAPAPAPSARPPMPPPAIRILPGDHQRPSRRAVCRSRALERPRMPDRISSVCWPRVGAGTGLVARHGVELHRRGRDGIAANAGLVEHGEHRIVRARRPCRRSARGTSGRAPARRRLSEGKRPLPPRSVLPPTARSRRIKIGARIPAIGLEA